MNSHLKEVKMSYYSHLKRSMGFSFAMLRLSLTCLVHAFFPNHYKTKYSESIKRAYNLIINEKT
jgi:hypothetical protein